VVQEGTLGGVALSGVGRRALHHFHRQVQDQRFRDQRPLVRCKDKLLNKCSDIKPCWY
jgi:hypothetical protein